MKSISCLLSAGIIVMLLSCTGPSGESDPGKDLWPDVETTMKPWTRWWWMGNGVDKENLTRRLEEFAEAGIGGVEITPIFGVKGYEDRFLQHLSPEWMEMLIHTLDEADRLGLKVDMILGTGWPFGGPQVEVEYAAGLLFIQHYKVKAGESFSLDVRITEPDQENLASLQYVFAYDDKGLKTDLTSLLGTTKRWSPETDHTVLAVFAGKTGQQVKRSAPGGEGFVLDHFSDKAVADYLLPYSDALAPVKGRLRAIFNDSYEVYHADYTPELFEEFKARRGYDLGDLLPVIALDSLSEDARLIRADYRETLSDLVLEDMSVNWIKWCNENGYLAKYQAHGCPGNLIDIYASADIPECESFYATEFDIPGLRREESDAREAYPDKILLKFASSAANVAGKPLTSSETLTWLREHFKTALSQCKPEIEQIFLSGVNHVFFHGSTYYPDEAAWPGWKFYASVNFVPTYTLWKDASYMFDYITRCQSLLQSGVSDNEILVYWPFHDVTALELDHIYYYELAINNKNEWLVPTEFHKLTTALMEQGYSVDFISDRFLEKTVIEGGKIKTPGRDYEALIIPDSRYMPISTMESLVRLNDAGGKLVFQGLPEEVPGYNRHAERTEELLALLEEQGDNLTVKDDVPGELMNKGIRGEGLALEGLDFIRRDLEDGKVYYVVNHTPKVIDQYVSMGTKAGSVIIMDPLSGETGRARVKGGTEVYLQMKPGDALLLRTFDSKVSAGDWNYMETSVEAVEITGNWELEFLEGGPAIPGQNHLQDLQSWTILGDDAEAFSGTARYTLTFENPDAIVNNWQLDLGDVRESARIRINGRELGCLWSVPFITETGNLDPGENILEIEVTNLTANRLRDLELKGVEWKIFYEINMVNRHYEEFDAKLWEPMPSGLLGPVTITPLTEMEF